MSLLCQYTIIMKRFLRTSKNNFTKSCLFQHGKEMQVAVNNLRDKIDSSQPSGPIDNL